MISIFRNKGGERVKRRLKIILLSILILISAALEFAGLSAHFGSFYSYVIKPIIWVFIGIITYFFFNDDVIPNLKYKKEVEFYTIVTTLIYFVIYFLNTVMSIYCNYSVSTNSPESLPGNAVVHLPNIHGK